jgi:Vitamin K-dependent gamma-carboxylase
VTTIAPPRRSGILDEIVDARGSLRAVWLLRVLVGAIVVLHLWPYLRADTMPVERFHVPWWSWLPVPSPSGYRALLWIGVAAGLAMAVGIARRVATWVALATITYLLFTDMTGFGHNRAFLVWLLFGLSLIPADGSFTLVGRRSPFVDEHDEHDEQQVLWPVYLMRAVVSSVYVTSGVAKLLNADWRSGLVLWDRVVRYDHAIPFDGWIRELLTSRAFHYFLSPAAIATELFIGLGLWFARTRLAAIWVAIAFHASIELTASVQTFSYSAIAALLLWVTPSVRDRRLSAPPALHGVVGRLDWLARFQLDAAAAGEPATLIDRDGTIRHGRDAVLTSLSRLPLTFPFVAPLLGAHRIRLRARQRADDSGRRG